jgi:hypothetical protein
MPEHRLPRSRLDCAAIPVGHGVAVATSCLFTLVLISLGYRSFSHHANLSFHGTLSKQLGWTEFASTLYKLFNTNLKIDVLMFNY